MSTSRRQFLKTLGTTAPALVLAAPGIAMAHDEKNSSNSGSSNNSSSTGPVSVPVFEIPLNIPPEAHPVDEDDEGRPIYELTQENATVEIIPGLQTEILGYNGMTPGPTIRVQADQEVIVRQINETDVKTTTHLHGGHMPTGNDGHPVDLVEPGDSQDYLYTNKQRPTTLWYHDHAMDLTGPHVYAGLAGFYIIEDEYERSLGLPDGDREIPLVIQDRTFTDEGALLYKKTVTGELGDTILVNGTPYPYLEVDTTRYRFRILNGSNARVYNLVLSNGAQFVQIGSDGGLLEAPVSRTNMVIAPAERLDVIIDFGEAAVGDQIVLTNKSGSGTTSQIMRFDVTEAESDESVVPDILSTIERLDPNDAVETRRWEFSRIPSADKQFVINGLPYDENRVDAYPRLGSTEIWELVNKTKGGHPIHIHDIMWQILDINGRPPGPHDAGWKDTFKLPPNGTVRVIGRFDDYTGDPDDIKSAYLMHCHILEHEDSAMMNQFIVVE
ncbi:Multicopper oxidase [hydrothermal vent metagenome]|uniref:Multicopper oxidase CueO n=1 Tax=hydrothermal vent metagenome TaxID=652676 RepID=A0A3B0XZP2_9ZZZZ